MSRHERSFHSFDKSIELNKNDIIPKLQNQIDCLTTDFDTLQSCKKILNSDRDMNEVAKNKLNLLLENISLRITSELEEHAEIIKRLMLVREIDQEEQKAIDGLNARYSRLAMQIEKIISSHSGFASVRSKGHTVRGTVSFKSQTPSKSAMSTSTTQIAKEKSYMKSTVSAQMNRSTTAKADSNREDHKRTALPPHSKHISLSNQQSPHSKKISKEFMAEMNSAWVEGLIKQIQDDSSTQHPADTKTLKSLAKTKSSSTLAEDALITNTSITKASHSTMDKTTNRSLFEFPAGTDIIKREIEGLKNLYLDLKNKFEIHNHPGFEVDFEKIKYENSKLIAENKIIQKDHAELMHTVHQLKKGYDEVIRENQELKKELKRLKRHIRSTNQQVENSQDISSVSKRNEDQENRRTENIKVAPEINQAEKPSTKVGRFLISGRKEETNVVEEDDELAASWVRRRL